MKKKYPYFGKSMGTNFPGSLNSIDLALFSYAMGIVGEIHAFPM